MELNNDEIKYLIDDELLLKLRNIGYNNDSFNIEDILSFFERKYNLKFSFEKLSLNFKIQNILENKIIFESEPKSIDFMSKETKLIIIYESIIKLGLNELINYIETNGKNSKNRS